MEIVSIYCNQNVNSVQVELKQWLYNHGDECPWNTGGWMKCIVTKIDMAAYGDYPASTAIVSVEFAKDKIIYTYKLSAPAAFVSGLYYYRNNISGNLAFGTKTPLTKDISLYKKLMVTNSNSILGSFRTGAANSASTAINTATVIQSGAANNLSLAMAKNNPYLVLGNKNEYTKYDAKPNPGSISINYSTDITEIYLV